MPPLCKGRWLGFAVTEGLLITLSYMLLSELVLLSNPSVSFADSSLYSREPILTHFLNVPFTQNASLVQREVARLCRDGGIVNYFKLYAIICIGAVKQSLSQLR